MKGRLQICNQAAIRPSKRSAPSNYHVITSLLAMTVQHFPYDGAQPPPGPVSLDRVANLAAYRVPDSHIFPLGPFMRRGPGCHLKN